MHFFLKILGGMANSVDSDQTDLDLLISFRRPACSGTKHPLRKNPVEKMGCQIARMFWSLTTIVY